MPDTGYVLAGAGTNNNSAGTNAWTSPGNIVSDNGSVAQSSVETNETTQYLIASNFGFSVPSGATIDGIEMQYERQKFGTGAASIQESEIKIVKGGVIGTTNKADTATNWTENSFQVVTRGAADDLWGETWTAADVNASDFGVAIRAKGTGSITNRTPQIDYVQIRITYTPGGGSAVPVIVNGYKRRRSH